MLLITIEINTVWLYNILSLVIPGCSAYFGSYLKKIGENHATKEDVAGITKQVEREV